MFSRLSRAFGRVTRRSPHKYTTVDSINSMDFSKFLKIKVKDIQCKHIIENIDAIREDKRDILRDFCQFKRASPHQRYTDIGTYMQTDAYIKKHKLKTNANNLVSSVTTSVLQERASKQAENVKLRQRFSKLIGNNNPGRSARAQRNLNSASKSHAKTMKILENHYSKSNSKSNKTSKSKR